MEAPTTTLIVAVTTVVSSVVTTIIIQHYRKDKTRAEVNLDTAKFMESILELGRNQVEAVKVDINKLKDAHTEALKQNTLLMEDNARLTTRMTEYEKRISQLEKNERRLAQENVDLKRQIEELLKKK